MAEWCSFPSFYASHNAMQPWTYLDITQKTSTREGRCQNELDRTLNKFFPASSVVERLCDVWLGPCLIDQVIIRRIKATPSCLTYSGMSVAVIAKKTKKEIAQQASMQFLASDDWWQTIRNSRRRRGYHRDNSHHYEWVCRLVGHLGCAVNKGVRFRQHTLCVIFCCLQALPRRQPWPKPNNRLLTVCENAFDMGNLLLCATSVKGQLWFSWHCPEFISKYGLFTDLLSPLLCIVPRRWPG